MKPKIDDCYDSDGSSSSSSLSSIFSSNSTCNSSKAAERCPICLNKFKYQDVAIPSSCNHEFCIECIEEWSKVIIFKKKKEILK
jgi:hypothetical protein